MIFFLYVLQTLTTCVTFIPNSQDTNLHIPFCIFLQPAITYQERRRQILRCIVSCLFCVDGTNILLALFLVLIECDLLLSLSAGSAICVDKFGVCCEIFVLYGKEDCDWISGTCHICGHICDNLYITVCYNKYTSPKSIRGNQI
jgi:hypothetical protein